MGVERTGLEGMSYEEIALDWIMKVAALTELDEEFSVISEEGGRALEDARTEHVDSYDGIAATTDEERHRRQEELTAAKREIIADDPGVAEKNRFLIALADQFDAAPLLEKLGMDASSPEGKVITEILSVPLLDLLISLRKYAESCPATSYMMHNQFLGLWAIYKAGQSTAEQASEFD